MTYQVDGLSEKLDEADGMSSAQVIIIIIIIIIIYCIVTNQNDYDEENDDEKNILMLRLKESIHIMTYTTGTHVSVLLNE